MHRGEIAGGEGLSSHRINGRSTPRAGLRRGKEKPPPPERTWAEEFWYQKQIAARTTIVVVLTDGETIRGRLEWYDRDCLKIHRDDGPNLMIRKDSVKYISKDESGTDGQE